MTDEDKPAKRFKSQEEEIKSLKTTIRRIATHTGTGLCSLDLETKHHSLESIRQNCQASGFDILGNEIPW